MKAKNLNDFYETYSEGSKKPVGEKRYRSIVKSFVKFLIEKVFDGHRVVIPARMGYLELRGKKQKVHYDEEGNIKGLAVNWKATKELWKRDPEAGKARKKIYHLNHHTDSIRYRFFWSKKHVNTLNKSLYSLRMTRTNKRRVAREIEKGKEYYVSAK